MKNLEYFTYFEIISIINKIIIMLKFNYTPELIIFYYYKMKLKIILWSLFKFYNMLYFLNIYLFYKLNN